MALTLGSGPFGSQAAGVFNGDLQAPKHLLYFEDSPRRVRVTFGGETVAASDRMKLLHESNHLPVYYFPVEDVHDRWLERSDHSTHCPAKGEASYWSVRVGDRIAENSMWSYQDPREDAPWLRDYAAFYWDKMDHWFEEEEEIFVHPRDPYHRVDVMEGSKHARVSVRGEPIVDSRRPLVLFETGLPPRYYVPEDDVRMELLVPTDTRTKCPYKGEATYWSVKAPDGIEEDLVWCYREPLRVVGEIAGHLAIFNERADFEIDGVAVERPETPFSKSIRGSRR
jgi:uncharacterized protein (DUF427 family)